MPASHWKLIGMAALEALRAMLAFARQDAAADIEGHWKWEADPARPNEERPRQSADYSVWEAPVRQQDLKRVGRKLDAIRKAEAVAGRAVGAGPDWLNDILDGRRAL